MTRAAGVIGCRVVFTDEAKSPLPMMQCCYPISQSHLSWELTLDASHSHDSKLTDMYAACGCRAGTSESKEAAAKTSAEKLTAEANSARAQAESARKDAESALAAAESLKAAAESGKARAEAVLTQQNQMLKDNVEIIRDLKKKLDEKELACRFATAAADKYGAEAQEASQRAIKNALQAKAISQELEAKKKSEEQLLELKKRVAELEQTKDSAMGTANNRASKAESDLRDAVAEEGRLRQKFEQVPLASKTCFFR